MTRRRGPRPSSGGQSNAPNIADQVLRQVQEDANHILKQMQGDFQPGDSVAVSALTNNAFIRQNWGDPNDPNDLAQPEHVQFRANLLDRVGPENLIKQYHDAFGLPQPSDEDYPVMLGEAAPKQTMKQAAITAVREVERDGAGRTQRVVDYAGPSPQMQAASEQEPADQNDQAQAADFMRQYNDAQMAGGG